MRCRIDDPRHEARANSIPEDLLEAAIASGADGRQFLREVRIPSSTPTIPFVLNQPILYACLLNVVIATLIVTTDQGQQIHFAFG